jgi:hypothetical protein
MSRRLQAVAASVVATGALGGAALAYGATPSAQTTKPAATPSASPAPERQGRHPCPNEGGGNNGGSSAPSQGSSSGDV